MNIELVADSANLSLEQFFFTIFYLKICLNNQENWRNIVHYVFLANPLKNVLFLQKWTSVDFESFERERPYGGNVRTNLNIHGRPLIPELSKNIIPKYDW